MIDHLLVKGPLGPDHLIGATQNVRCDVGRAHNKLRQETDTLVLCPKKYLPRRVVQSGGERPAGTTKIRDCGGVVTEQRLPTGPLKDVLRPVGRTELLAALSS